MVLLTLIGREMRAAARQAFSYQLRMVGAGVLLVVGALAIAESAGDVVRGGLLFARLHATILPVIWVLVPLLTADCISRERREHTLPLLFLTPLRPWQIVLAKGLAHGLRAFTLWLAVLPVLTIPFIAGGVSWMEALLSVLLSFGSICLAMGAGLLASTGSPVWMRSMALAAFLGFLFFFGFVLELGYLNSGGGIKLPFAFGRPNPHDLRANFGFGLQLAMDTGASWQYLFGSTLPPWLRAAGYLTPTAPLGTNLPILINFGVVAFSCFLALLLLIGIAAWHVSRTWQEGPPSARAVKFERQLCSPLYFKNAFKKWMLWELNRNPIGWLERRTWSARLVTWVWFALFICIYSSLLGNLWLYQDQFHHIQSFLAWLLLASIAVSSAGSFRRERETGLLELLVVSPIAEWQIIAGRLRGLWTQFLPAIVLLLVLWLFCASFLAQGKNEAVSVLFYGASLLTLPVVGLYNSLARRSFTTAFLSTLLLGVVLPFVVARADECVAYLMWLFGQPAPFQSSGSRIFLTMLIQTAAAGVCAWRLHDNLERRQFALERSGV